jgi:hypothetical protein
MKVASPGFLVVALIWFVTGVAAPLAAQEAPARFVDDQTAAVVRFDLAKLDLDAAGKWLAEALGPGNAADGVRAAQQTAGAAVQDLKKAGAKEVFLFVSLADLPFRGPAPGFVVVPLPKAGAGDGDAIGRVLTTGKAAGANAGGGADWKAETVEGFVVAGQAATLDRLRVPQDAAAAAREDLAKVLAAGDTREAAVVAAVVPTDDMRKVFEQMVPSLPAQVGGGPSTTVTHGGRWARLELNLPPQGSLRLTFQSENAAAAEKFSELVSRAVKVVAGLPELRRAAGDDAMNGVASAIQPKVEADRVVVSLDQQQMNDLTRPLAAAAGTARRRAALQQSANNVRQLLVGCVMYADAHQGQFPDTLDQAAKTAAGGNDAAAAALLRNPRGAARFVYVKPKGALNAQRNVAETLVVYEKADMWDPPVVMGFADGHVITVKDEAEYRKRVEAAGAPQ